ncbi:MAG: hypothetical protein V7782_06040 [Psychromonas sp.]
MKFRLTFYTILFLSLLCSLFSFFALSGAMLPYQDATQEMLIKQANDIKLWEFSLLGCLLISLISGVALYIKTRKNEN